LQSTSASQENAKTTSMELASQDVDHAKAVTDTVVANNKARSPSGAISCESGNESSDCRPAQRPTREVTKEALTETKNARAVLYLNDKAKSLVVSYAPTSGRHCSSVSSSKYQRRRINERALPWLYLVHSGSP
jgi:hypothetical protein